METLHSYKNVLDGNMNEVITIDFVEAPMLPPILNSAYFRSTDSGHLQKSTPGSKQCRLRCLPAICQSLANPRVHFVGVGTARLLADLAVSVVVPF